jgi:hypothetical protein
MRWSVLLKTGQLMARSRVVEEILTNHLVRHPFFHDQIDRRRCLNIFPLRSTAITQGRSRCRN